MTEGVHTKYDEPQQRAVRCAPSVGVRCVAVSLVLSGAGCSGSPGESAGTSWNAGGDPTQVLATIDTQQVTLADVRVRAGRELDQLETQHRRSMSNVVEQTLNAILRERAVEMAARKQGVSANDFVAREIASEFQPAEADIVEWYNANRDLVGQRDLTEVRSQIAEYLRDQRQRRASEDLDQRLLREMGAVVHFQPYRARFDNDGAPYAGRRGAPVTVVEFSDFECPFCQRFAPTLRRLTAEFGDQVYVVYRQLPITAIHPNAFKAAEASLCAHEQSKFWEMHDVMFLEQDRLGVADLREKAQRLGLKQDRFVACLDSGRYVQQIQRDIREAAREGVDGTPAIFINGARVAGGAVAYDVLADAVRRELIRLQPAR